MEVSGTEVLTVLAARDCCSVAVVVAEAVVVIVVTLVCIRSHHHHTRLSTAETKSKIFSPHLLRVGNVPEPHASRRSQPQHAGGLTLLVPKAPLRRSVNVNEVKVEPQRSYDF